MNKKNRYKIESNVPPPKGAKSWFSTVSAMRFGDSVLLSDKKDARDLCRAISKQSGVKAVQRKQPNGEYRVWKIEGV